MNLGYLAYRNMVSKPLGTLMSVFLLMLSVALVTFAVQLDEQVEGQLNKNVAPFNMVVGAKGSPLQLVLSSVLHMDVPTGNIPLKEAMTLKKNPLVASAIPVSYGDNYKGYRILGTEIAYIEKYEGTLAEGELFDHAFEVVAGSNVAKRLDLKIGDTFHGAHGLVSAEGEAHEEHPYTVKGLLNPTGTVIDNLLITNLESIWEAHHHDEEDTDHEEHDEHEAHDEHEGHDGHEDHDEHGAHEDHDEHEAHEEHEEHEAHDDHEAHEEHHDLEDKQITSLLVEFKNPMGMVQLPRFINENTSMQAALPGYEMERLSGLLGSGAKAVNGIAYAILFVSGLSIFIGLLRTIRERRQELALLRTYGLRTGQLLLLGLLESLFLTVIGFVIGWLFGRLGVWLASQYMQATYGYGLTISGPNLTEVYFLGAILLLAMIATLLASVSIFKLNVAKTLSHA